MVPHHLAGSRVWGISTGSVPARGVSVLSQSRGRSSPAGRHGNSGAGSLFGQRPDPSVTVFGATEKTPTECGSGCPRDGPRTRSPSSDDPPSVGILVNPTSKEIKQASRLRLRELTFGPEIRVPDTQSGRLSVDWRIFRSWANTAEQWRTWRDSNPRHPVPKFGTAHFRPGSRRFVCVRCRFYKPMV